MAQLEEPFKHPDRRGWQQRVRVNGRRLQKGGFKTKQDARDWRDVQAGIAKHSISVNELIDRYLRVYSGAQSTKDGLHWKLGKARVAFGSVKAEALTAEEIAAWRLLIPEGHRFETTQALRQAFAWAIEAGLISRSAAAKVRNPAPTRAGILPFESWAEVDAVAHELGATWGPIAVFGAGTGLRPGEWIALERSDLQLDADVPHVLVQRRMTKDGKIVAATKDGKPRQVPLRQRVIDALPPVRLHTKLLFPAAEGGHIDLHNWRHREWKPALDAAGLADRGPYALRHTYAAMYLRTPGLNTFALARRLGTSLEMIEQTYGHLAPDAGEYELRLLNERDFSSDGRIEDAEQVEAGGAE